MKKSLFLLMAMVASSALAQKNVDISAEQFKSGAANSELTALGREAAASGKRLVVTAPQYMHAQIAARIRAGGDAEIVLKDGFYETLLVRVEDKAPEPAKPEPRPAPVAAAPKPAPAPAPVETTPVAPKVEQAPPPPPQPVVATPPPAAEPVVEAPAPAPVAEPVATAAEPVAADAAIENVEPDASAAFDPKAPVMLNAAEPGDTDPTREFMEKRYNEGKRIVARIEPNRLERGDVIFTGKGVAVVVRRDRNRMVRMWLVGPLNLNQISLVGDGLNKYNVLSSIIN
ncbi:MAG TPA: hypothetical protein VFN25_13955 [Dokdonella sp.]|uniref:hypothetical protein n=1 Tax=Dokdonella sp. TaxID=2291710 RepID=UPI002D802486|nr:hypothetical protein [Dokdonella sp.]HET9033992.1 hypothetical protein [Dokdonella sp.]